MSGPLISKGRLGSPSRLGAKINNLRLLSTVRADHLKQADKLALVRFLEINESLLRKTSIYMGRCNGAKLGTLQKNAGSSCSFFDSVTISLVLVEERQIG